VGGIVARAAPKPPISYALSPRADGSATLAAMRRVGRPPIGKEPRHLIAIRVDPSVLESFRKEARRRRVGYQTLMNEVLAEHTGKDVA
jgi:uncharacterized protein (DUF4415 family)